jgi:hypothetical protein
MTVSVPLPLKLRTGLRVSTFNVTKQPSASLSGTDSNCGVFMNAGSIDATASRTRRRSSRATHITVRRLRAPAKTTRLISSASAHASALIPVTGSRSRQRRRPRVRQPDEMGADVVAPFGDWLGYRASRFGRASTLRR